MGKYRKKAMVDAFQTKNISSTDDLPDWFLDYCQDHDISFGHHEIIVKTQEGVRRLENNVWIIRSNDGTICYCDNAEFVATYEEI